jgi:hypothetical protein
MSGISISCCVSKLALPYKTSLAIAMAIENDRDVQCNQEKSGISKFPNGRAEAHEEAQAQSL